MSSDNDNIRTEYVADRGRLNVTSHPAGDYKPLLPLNPDDDGCRSDNPALSCFKAGKQRVSIDFQIHRYPDSRLYSSDSRLHHEFGTVHIDTCRKVNTNHLLKKLVSLLYISTTTRRTGSGNSHYRHRFRSIGLCSICFQLCCHGQWFCTVHCVRGCC